MISLRVAGDMPPAHSMLFRTGEAISAIARVGIAVGFFLLIAPAADSGASRPSIPR